MQDLHPGMPHRVILGCTNSLEKWTDLRRTFKKIGNQGMSRCKMPFFGRDFAIVASISISLNTVMSERIRVLPSPDLLPVAFIFLTPSSIDSLKAIARLFQAITETQPLVLGFTVVASRVLFFSGKVWYL